MRYEYFHKIKSIKVGRNGLIALKLDVNKAYNRIKRCYLENVMVKLSFLALFIQLIMSYIIIISFSIILNGKVKGSINP